MSRLPLRYCCNEHFALLIGFMGALDIMLMLSIWRMLKAGES